MEESEFRGGTDSAPVLTRVRLLRDDGFKHPLLRVEDDWREDGGKLSLIRQRAVTADRVVLMPAQDAEPAKLRAAIEKAGFKVERIMPASKLWIVHLGGRIKLDSVPRALSIIRRMSPLVAWVEPAGLSRAALAPDDPKFSSLWGLRNLGQDGGAADADTDAEEAWDLHTGSKAVRVAVIDTGIDANHPDLINNLWINPGEIPGDRRDNDGNGYVDDVNGWDFVAEDSDPNDENGHGTHCAGTIGAVGNNGVGIAGVCWRVSLVSLRVLDERGFGWDPDIAEAIAYASAQGVEIASNSFGSRFESLAMKSALAEAARRDVLMVAAAGNESSDTDVYPVFPANSPLPNVISVGASTRRDALASFSNFGKATVDLAAPGLQVFSTLPRGAYGDLSGTSMAAPHVAGAAALLKSFRPSLRASELRQILLQSVDAAPAFQGKTVSGGRLNIRKAMEQADGLIFSGDEWLASGGIGGPFAPATSTMVLNNRSASSVEWTVTKTASWISLSSAGGRLAPGETQEIRASLNTATGFLEAGTHRDVIVVRGAGREFAVPVSLAIGSRDLFTELFDSAGKDQSSDLSNQSFLFTPDRSRDFYSVTRIPVTTFPVNPSTGKSVDLSSQSWIPILLPRASRVSLYGLRFPYLIVRDEGYITFSLTEGVFMDPLDAHFDAPRVSGLASWRLGASTASYVVLKDRVAVTWLKRQAGSPPPLSGVQVEMFFDGRIRISHVNVSNSGVVGLSAGGGQPRNFTASDFSRYPEAGIQMALPVELQEGAGPQQGSVRIPAASSRATKVSLTSSLSAEVQVPATVTIPAGKTEASFALQVLDDTFLDGSQPVTVTGASPPLALGSGIVTVHDNETAALSLAEVAVLREGSSVQGEVSVSAPPERAVAVTLSSDAPQTASVPASVTIPAGETRAAFSIVSPDDDRFEGVEQARITARVKGWSEAETTVAVEDNEAFSMALSLPSEVNESSGRHEGTVTISGRFPVSTVISLQSSSPGRLRVPESVEIVGGTRSATFEFEVLDNTLREPDHLATVIARVDGSDAVSADLRIVDDEPLRFVIDAQPQTRTAGQPFDVVIRAVDEHGALVSRYGGQVTISGNGGATLVDTWSMSAFSNGVATARVVVPVPQSALVLTVSDGGAQQGASNQFTVSVNTNPLTFRYVDHDESALDNVSFWFLPSGKPEFYAVRRVAAESLPVDSFGGVAMERNERVRIGTVPYYGVAYDEITLGDGGIGLRRSGEEVPSQIPWIHVGDLSTWNEKVSYKQLDDRIAITWSTPQGNGIVSPVQLELFIDGRIRVTHVKLAGLGRLLIFLDRGGDGVRESALFWLAQSQILILDLPAVKREGEGEFIGKIRLEPAPEQDLWVKLASGNSDAISVPEALRVPAGLGSVEFPVNVIDDTALDGDQSSWVTVAAPGFGSDAREVVVRDNEAALLTLELPAQIRENQGEFWGTVRTSQPPTAPLPVELRELPDSLLFSAPRQVIIPAGQTSVTFPCSSHFDRTITGEQTIEVKARITGWEEATALVRVEDITSRTFQWGTPAIVEGKSGVCYLSVGSFDKVGYPLEVTLTASDPAQIQIPETVVIPAGAGSVAVPVRALDNWRTEGSRSVEITANAPGFPSATGQLRILDDDVHRLAISTIPSPQTGRTAFRVVITAMNASNETLPSYFGNVSLSATAGGVPVMVSPSVVAIHPYGGGVWGGEITLSPSAPAKDVVLTAQGQGRETGSSNPFELVSGALRRFEISVPPGVRSPFEPIPVTVRALDALGNLVTGHEGDITFLGTSYLNRPRVLLSEVGTVFESLGGGLPQELAFIELINAGRAPENLQGWTIYLYSGASYPGFRAKHVFNASAPVAAGGVWTVWSAGRPREFGDSNSTLSSSNLKLDVFSPGAVALYDSAGKLVDVLRVNDSSAAITVPSTIPPEQWSGAGAPRSGPGGSFQRVGSDDQDSAADWTFGTTTEGRRANGLTLPFNSAAEIAVDGPATFSQGVWEGTVAVLHEADGFWFRTGSATSAVIQMQRSIGLFAPEKVQEGGPEVVGSVRVWTPYQVDQEVTFSSSVGAAPAKVTIPAGQMSAEFRFSVPGDGRYTGDRVATLSAALTEPDGNILRGTDTVTVVEEDQLTLAGAGNLLYWDNSFSSRPRVIPMGAMEGRQIDAVAVGAGHFLALDSEGMVYGWGQNALGQIGDGGQEDRAEPVRVGEFGTIEGQRVVAIAAGDRHSLALTARGEVFAWGANDSGQLGVASGGPSDGRASPLPVAIAGKPIVAISAGGAHSLAVDIEGTVYAWGANDSGQLGDGTTTSRPEPRAITGGALAGRVVTAISAGARHSVALSDSGSVVSWGENQDRQLGDGTASDRLEPIQATDIVGDIVAIAAGGNLTGVLHKGLQAITELTAQGPRQYPFISAPVFDIEVAEQTRTCWRSAEDRVGLSAPGYPGTSIPGLAPGLDIAAWDAGQAGVIVATGAPPPRPRLLVTAGSDGLQPSYYSDQELPSRNVPVSLKLQNWGDAPVVGINATLEGPQASSFVLSDLPKRELAPGESMTLQVSLALKPIDTRNAVLRIVSDSSPQPFVMPLVGTEAVIAPEITRNPQTLLVRLGDPASFNVTATGSVPTAAEWRRGQTIVSTTDDLQGLTIPSAGLADGGDYVVELSNPAGTATSEPVALQVVDSQVQQISAFEGSTVTLTQNVAGPRGGIEFVWDFGNLRLRNGLSVKGADTASLRLGPLQPGNSGTYVCSVSRPGSQIPGGAIALTVVPRPVVSGMGPFQWRTGAWVDMTVQASNAPTSFSATRLPKGLTLNRASGRITGRPEVPVAAGSFSVTATNAAGASRAELVDYSVLSLPSASVGSFTGLVDRSTALSMPGGQTSQGHGGFLSNVVLTEAGAYSGSLLLEGKRYAFRGRVELAPGGHLEARALIARGAKVRDLTVMFRVDPERGELTGTVSDGLPGGSVAFRGVRNPWLQASAAPLTLDGIYTASLQWPEPNRSAAGDTGIPQGTGWLSFKVAANGSITWTARLADNSLVSGASSLGANGEIPIHRILYRLNPLTAGSLQGWLQIDPSASESSVASPNPQPSLTGTLDWFKKPAPQGRQAVESFAAGFPVHPLETDGGRYQPPPVGTPVLGLTAGAVDNARLVFAESGNTPNREQLLRIDGKNQVFLPGTVTNNPTGVKLELVPAKGSFFGSYKAPATGKLIRFSGVLLPKAGKGVAPLQVNRFSSGQVTLEPLPVAEAP